MGGGPQQEELLPRALPPAQSTAWSQESDRGSATRDGRRAVAHAEAPCFSSRSRGRLLRSPEYRTDPPSPRPSPRTLGLRRRAGRKGGVTTEEFHRKRACRPLKDRLPRRIPARPP